MTAPPDIILHSKGGEGGDDGDKVERRRERE
jgi:hypothetical protein